VKIPVRTKFVEARLKDLEYMKYQGQSQNSDSSQSSSNPSEINTTFTNNYRNEWLGETATLEFGSFLRHWLEFKEWSEEDDTRETFYYLASLPMNKYFPMLCDDVVVPEIPRTQKKSGNLWIGNKGQITPMHFDFSTGDPGMDGLHGVVFGKKQFKLFDPQKNAGLIPRKNIWGRFHQAVVSVGGLPRTSDYPLFSKAIYISIELNAGEMLYIPKLWWHHVVTLEPSISINFWFQHLGSEKLKLTRHWVTMVDYLEAVEKMQITSEKMRNVLQFFGIKVTDELVRYYMENIHEFMLLPQFIASFANGTRAPWMAGIESEQFAMQLCEKVKNWIYERYRKVNVK